MKQCCTRQLAFEPGGGGGGSGGRVSRRENKASRLGCMAISVQLANIELHVQRIEQILPLIKIGK